LSQTGIQNSIRDLITNLVYNIWWIPSLVSLIIFYIFTRMTFTNGFRSKEESLAHFFMIIYFKNGMKKKFSSSYANYLLTFFLWHQLKPPSTAQSNYAKIAFLSNKIYLFVKSRYFGSVFDQSPNLFFYFCHSRRYKGQ
jgi:hypothetical protein